LDGSMGELVGSVVVILANSFNPTICTQLWLIRNGVFAEEDFKEGFIYAPPVVRVLTEYCEFTMLPERIQLAFRHPQGDNKQILTKVLDNFVDKLPQTPYQTIGFNFVWQWRPEDQSRYGELIRHVFLNSKNPIAIHFGEKDARFGIYMSKDVALMRMKLDIKPIKVGAGNSAEEKLQIAFNFERQVAGDLSSKQIHESINQWNAMKDIASTIEADFEKGLGT